ncbi:TetR/AcrR family transcriptional regulator [Sulfidibacter corallicola]
MVICGKERYNEPMTDTRTRILDTAQELIQTRGFCAMSFQHIAEIVGIKKPSIIHHFASKFELGKAVIQRYHQYFLGAMQGIQHDPNKSNRDALEFYFTPYLDFGESGDKVCLCGALAGEFMALGPEMQAEVREFFAAHERWLEEILTAGKAAGEFRFGGTSHQLARMFLSALQGGLLVKRATGSTHQLLDVIDVIRKQVH